jgi:hypothetical protein
MSIDSLFEDIDDMISRYVAEHYSSTTTEALGLDGRAATRQMWVSTEGIVTQGETQRLEYYGGFDYVDKEYVRRVGSYTFWSIEDERVRDHACKALSADMVRHVRKSYGDHMDDED